MFLTTVSYTCFLYCFRAIELNWTIILHSVAVAISSETQVPELEGVVGEGKGEGVSEVTGSTLRPPDFNPCYNYVESVNPMFDSRRVFLGRTFFIN